MSKCKKKTKKREFSKQIFIFLAVICTSISVLTVILCYKSNDLTPLVTLIEKSFECFLVGIGFYYWKSKAENKIKLQLIAKKNGITTDIVQNEESEEN